MPFVGNFYLYSLLGMAAAAFWIWMLLDCALRESEKGGWLYVLLFASFPGAVAYFLLRWLPRRNLSLPIFLHRWTRRAEIRHAEADARYVGNAYHFVKLGDLMRQTGQWDRAGDAYGKAVAKEPANKEALWGSALVDVHKRQFDRARRHLGVLVGLDPQYRFGDVLFAYGRTLVALSEPAEARKQLESYLRQWGHPEAHLLLAEALAQEGNSDEACRRIEAFLEDLRFGWPGGGSRFYWKRKAKALLGRIRRGAPLRP